MLAEQEIILDKYIENKKEHIEKLHKASKGWITVAQKNPEYKQRHYRYKDLGQAVGETNFYISQNTFYRTYRRIEELKELKALYIDLDCYETKYTKKQIIYLLGKDYFNQTIPIPNLTIDSGRGLYLVWNITAVPKMALPLWKAVENYLYKQLKEFGADAKATDPTRILRVAGTINTKSNTRVKILDEYNYKYTLREIQKEFLPEIKPKERAKGRPKKVVSLFNKYSLHYTRILDLKTLCELRKWDLRGHREEILFLYRYWSCCFVKDTKEALRMALELNKQFKYPLQENEVIKSTKSAETVYLSNTRKYNYKNNTLIEMLGITEEEQEKLKTIIGTKEKNKRNRENRNRYKKEAGKSKRRNKQGLTKREQQKQDKVKKVKELKLKGLSNIKIAEKLGVNKSTVGRLLKI